MTQGSEQGVEGLADRLRRLIGEQGPITFATFMEAALYDPVDGFYARSPVGRSGHFVTSPHVSAAFGELVARQVEEFFELLDRPPAFTVVEVGAGDGTLARQVLGALGPGPAGDVRYVAVERDATARRSLGDIGLSVVARLADVPTVAAGCVLANELVDNLPFHRVRRNADGLVEVLVDVREGDLVPVEGPLSDPLLAELAPHLEVGQEAPVSPAALAFLDEATGVLDRGYVWLADYGFLRGEPPTPAHGYRRHRPEEDVLANPGSRDITAGVDFGALVRHAGSRGHRVWGPVPQREALLALGLGRWDRRMREAQARALGQGRGLEAVRAYSERSRASLLVDPSGLGGAHILCLGIGADQAPRSVRSAR